SAVARVSKKMHPDKNAIWFFLGLGPEHRTQWDGNFENKQSMPLLSQELGIRIFKPKSLFSYTEAGFATVWTIRKKDGQDRFHVANIFIRISSFNFLGN